MLVLSLCVAFAFGWILGKMLNGKGQKYDGEFGDQHMKGRSPWARKLEIECGQQDVVLYLSRTGTKVHIDTQCPKLNGADPNTLIERRLCKHCMKKESSM